MTSRGVRGQTRKVFTVELPPARHGDAIWIEYGDPDTPFRILIDGGATKSTSTLIARLIRYRTRPDEQHDLKHDFELIVLSHIDGDHLAGLLRVFEDRSLPLRTRDVWFNGWKHLPTDRLGAKQAERLTAAILDRDLPWNAAFGGKAVKLPRSDAPAASVELPRVELRGGMVVTLLSPTHEQLAELRPVWAKEVAKAGLVSGLRTRRKKQADRLGEDGPPTAIRPGGAGQARLYA